jgi:hypothetical protein
MSPSTLLRQPIRQLLTLLLPACCAAAALAQPGTAAQTVRGVVVDKESKATLPGVNVVVLLDSGRIAGTTTGADGSYRLEQVPVGRRTIEFSFIGYSSLRLDNIVVGSGREVIVNVELEEHATQLQEFEVVSRHAGEVRNEMALISARQFSVEETERYAGSRGDPGRMASNFAGVQGADDSRNDIVVRGNSPQGVLWRFEGINIPNPNHFSIPGTGGGPVTILNNKYLADSDFFTGAFPAEYGNATAGVFDLRMRNGNNQKHEYSIQFGFLGTELLAEGPVGVPGKASYLVSYRYSTLQLFNFMGINVGTDAIPQYQDAAFRLSLPMGSKGHLALWGIGGNSTIDIVLSGQERPDTTTLIYGENDRDQYFRSRMGTVGATWTRTLDERTYLKVTAAAAHARTAPHHDFIYRHVEDGRYIVDSLPRQLGYRFQEDRLMLHASLNSKLGRRTTLKAGATLEQQHLFYVDSVRTLMPDAGEGGVDLLGNWRKRWDSDVDIVQAQPYLQLKHRFNDRLTLAAGLSSLYSSINRNSLAPAEPRLGLAYDMGRGRRLSFGYGLHSQLQAGYLYFHGPDSPGGDPREVNRDMGLTRSHHLVLGHDRVIGATVRMRTEVYYQHLFNIPVSGLPSSFSLVNTGAGFSRFFPDSLVNSGRGRNMGVELTLERAFSKGYYFLFTGSLFDARYQGSDMVWRNTSFNGRYAVNGLFAREITTRGRSAFTVGTKVTLAGGRWYGPVDRAASDAAQEVVYADATVNTRQFRPYLRADLKLAYRWNRPRVMHEFAVDLVNVTGHRNILTLTYAPDHPSGDPIREEYQLGFLPIFHYKVEF